MSTLGRFLKQQQQQQQQYFLLTHKPQHVRVRDSDTIEGLSTIIAKNTNKVADNLRSQHLPFPTHGVDGPTRSLIPAEATETEAARVEVINAAQKLQSLMLGPQDYLQSFTVKHKDPQLVQRRFAPTLMDN